MAGYKRKYNTDSTMTNYKQFKQRVTRKRVIPSRYAVPPAKVELKYDDGVTSTLIPSGGSVILLSTIANGTGPSERIGRHVAYHDLVMNWTVLNNLASGDYFGRVIIAYDKQTNTSLPGVTEVMNGTDVNALYNPDTRSRFSILYDKSFNIAVDTSAAYYQKQTVSGRNQMISLKGKKCEFLGATADISDIDSGSIIMILLTSTTNAYVFSERNRIQYFD